MGDVSTEPTMEEILSSIKRVIEESEAAPAGRPPRPAARTAPAAPKPIPEAVDEVLELSERAPFAAIATPRAEAEPDPSPTGPTTPAPETILSPGAAQASRGSLEALSRLVVKPETAGGDTLEGMVREMLRPMLRDWLDAQLPAIVEAMVAREIARISDRGF